MTPRALSVVSWPVTRKNLMDLTAAKKGCHRFFHFYQDYDT